MTLGMFCKACGGARDTRLSYALCMACFKKRRKEYDRGFRTDLGKILKRWWKARIRRFRDRNVKGPEA